MCPWEARGAVKGAVSENSFFLFVRRPVAVTMLYAAVVLLGVVSLTRLAVDLLSDLSYPKLTVWTTYPGAAPAGVKASVTVPIEGALSALSGLRRMGLSEPGGGVAPHARVPRARGRRSQDEHAAGAGMAA